MTHLDTWTHLLLLFLLSFDIICRNVMSCSVATRHYMTLHDTT